MAVVDFPPTIYFSLCEHIHNLLLYSTVEDHLGSSQFFAG